MKELLIEYALRSDSNEYVFRTIEFGIDEDTGARSVDNVSEFLLRKTTPSNMALDNIWWPEFDHVKIVVSSTGAVLMDEPVDDYFIAARRASAYFAVCICDFKNVYDDDGALNTDWIGVPVMTAYEAAKHEELDMDAYRFLASGDAAIVGSVCEADRGKVCHHGDTFGKCPSSQCVIWTEEELLEG